MPLSKAVATLSDQSSSDQSPSVIGVTRLCAGAENTWNDYVDHHPLATSAHAAQWKRLIERVFGKECHYLQAVAGDKLVGVLPLVHMRSRLFGNFMVSVPYVNYGGVLADSAEVSQLLLREASRLATSLGAGSVEYREQDQREQDQRQGEAPCCSLRRNRPGRAGVSSALICHRKWCGRPRRRYKAPGCRMPRCC